MPEGAAANNVAIKLYPDADGRVGRIEVNDRGGVRLGFLTEGASGFTIQRGAMGRFTASPLAISPQQALRDQGIVRQVHAAQSLGPPDRYPAARVAAGQSEPKQSAQQPGAAARSATTEWLAAAAGGCRTGRASSNRPGLQRQPGAVGAPNAPGLQRPGLQNRPAPRLPAAPKGKPPPKKKR